MEHFDTHHWSNECEQTREIGWYNVNGVKDCKEQNHSVVLQYSVKNSHKCINTTPKVSRINMFNQKLQNWKKFCFFGIFSAYFGVKKVI